MKNKVLFGKEAIAEMKKGIDIVYEAVSGTLGASGKNAIYRSFYSRNPMTTNDGVSIAKMIDLEDEAQALGADLIKQAAQRSNDEAGDGTTTSVVLAKALIDEGLKKIEQGVNPMILRKEMQEAGKKIIKKLKEKAKKIETDNDIFNIANISMENPEIAQIVVDSVKKVGENGTVLVEESNRLTIEKEEIEGIKFDKGFLTPFMITDSRTQESVLNDVDVLVTDKMFSMNSDIFLLLEEISKRGINQLFVICENIQGELLASLIANRMAGKFLCVAVQRPNDPDVLEDIAILTNAKTITQNAVSGQLVPMHYNYLGKAKKVVVTKDSTLIVGGYGKKEDIDNRVKSISNEIKETDSQYKKGLLKERMAKLVGGIVILKVGAPTEAEMKYLKLKVDDAVASTRAAIEEGIVVGGGRALYDISQEKPLNSGEEVVYNACKQPIKKIIENAGFDPDTILKDTEAGVVFNALTYKTTKNPIKDGIVDPAKVERCALENAISVASTFITNGCAIVDVEDKVNKA